MSGNKKYAQKFKEQWMALAQFKNWLSVSAKGKEYAHCKWCRCDISIANGGKPDLARHGTSKKHRNNTKYFFSQRTLHDGNKTTLDDLVLQHCSDNETDHHEVVEYCEDTELSNTKLPETEFQLTSKDTLISDKKYVVLKPSPSKHKSVYTERQSEDISLENVQALTAKLTNECDLYGLLLAKKLKKLDEHQRDLAMHEIDNILFRAKMRSKSAKSKKRNTKSPVFVMAQENNVHSEDDNICRDPMDSYNDDS